MGKSLGNFINLEELFTGSHKLLQQAYSPMTIRFFILQAQYRSTLDFSNEALQAAGKGLERLMKALQTLEKLKPSTTSSVNVNELQTKCYEAMNDDLNSPVAISYLFEAVRIINSVNDGKETLDEASISQLRSFMHTFVFDILGLQNEQAETSNNDLTAQLIDTFLNLRLEAKQNKDFALSDKIRNALTNLGIEIKDRKDGFEWEIK